MSSLEEDIDEITENGLEAEAESMFRTVQETDVSLDEMMSLACRQGKLDIVELLLESGAHVGYRNKAGNTPLLEACSQGHVDVARYLLDHQADIDAPTETTSDSALTWACTLGNESIVEILLERKANVEHRTKDGCTALMFAALAGHVKVAEMLLDNNAEINVESDSNKDSPLTFACWKGHVDVVELLLKRGANIEHRTKEGFTPLMFAALGGHTEVAKKLLERGAKVNVPSGSNNDIPLTSACWKGHHDVVRLLLEYKSDIEHRTKDGCTPLMLAAREGHLSVAKLILAHGAQANVPSGSENNIPLTLACWKGHYEVVELLLENGSNIEHRNKAGCTPLMLAAREGHVKTTQLLLEKGAQINQPSGSNDDTPLTLACWKGHHEVVDLLLKYKSIVDHQTKTGCTPLMEATREGHKEVAELLLNSGADVELPDNYGQSPLFMACWKGHADVARLLLEHTANRDCRTKTGITPLFQACRENHVAVVELLVEYGASINAPFPNSRENPLTLAAEKGHYELVKLLLRHGAHVECRTKKGCTPFYLGCKEGHKEIAKALMKENADMEASDIRNNTPLIAAFRNGHDDIVEWLLKYVNHLPSEEQSKKCLIAPTDDKDREDVLIGRTRAYEMINKAKKSREQAALRNAQNLVQQVDEEKNREENKRKKAAAKKRDKRKKKKAREQAELQASLIAQAPLENRPLDDAIDGLNEDNAENHDQEAEDKSPETVLQDDLQQDAHISDSSDVSTTEEATVIENRLNNEERHAQAKPEVPHHKKDNCIIQKNLHTKVDNVLRDKGQQITETVDIEQKPTPSQKKSNVEKTPEKKINLINNLITTSAATSEGASQTMSARSQSTAASASSHSTTEESKPVATIAEPVTPTKTPASSKSTSKSESTSDKQTKLAKGIVVQSRLSTAAVSLSSAGAVTTATDRSADSGRPATAGSADPGWVPSPAKPAPEKEQPQSGGLSPKSKQASPVKQEQPFSEWKEVTRNANSKTVVFQRSAPNALCGRVIGRGGSKINSITEESGAQITIGKLESKTSTDRVITIKGSLKAVQKAKSLVTLALNTPSLNQPQSPEAHDSASILTSSADEGVVTVAAPVRGNYAAITAEGDWPTLIQANSMLSSTSIAKTGTKTTQADTPTSTGRSVSTSDYNSRAELEVTRPQAHRSSSAPEFAVPVVSAAEGSSKTVSKDPWQQYQAPQSVGACTSAMTTAQSSTSQPTVPMSIARMNFQTSPTRMNITMHSTGVEGLRGGVRTLAAPSSSVLMTDQSSVSYSDVISGLESKENRPDQLHSAVTTVAASTSDMVTTSVCDRHTVATAAVSEPDESCFGAIGSFRDSLAHTKMTDSQEVPVCVGTIGQTILSTRKQDGNSPVKQGEFTNRPRLPPSSTSELNQSSSYYSSTSKSDPKDKYPIYSPWSSNTSELGSGASETFNSSPYNKYQQGTLPGMELFSSSSSFFSGTLGPLPWSKGEDEGRLDRARSISWSGQPGSQGDFIQSQSQPTETTTFTTSHKSSSEFNVNASAFKPLSSGSIWSPISPHSNTLNIACENETMDSHGWDNSNSNSSSRSSSRQELSTIMDSDVQSENTNMWDMPSQAPKQAAELTSNPHENVLCRTSPVPNQQGNLWATGRGAYSAPSSPSMPRSSRGSSSSDPKRSVNTHPSADDMTGQRTSWPSNVHNSQERGWDMERTQMQRVSSGAGSPSEQQSPRSGHSKPGVPPYLQEGGSFGGSLQHGEMWREAHQSKHQELDLVTLLSQLSLEKYRPVLEQNNLDGDCLLRVTEDGLESVGLPKGPRLKLLNAIKKIKSTSFAGSSSGSSSDFQSEVNTVTKNSLLIQADQTQSLIPKHRKHTSDPTSSHLQSSIPPSAGNHGNLPAMVSTGGVTQLPVQNHDQAVYPSRPHSASASLTSSTQSFRMHPADIGMQGPQFIPPDQFSGPITYQQPQFYYPAGGYYYSYYPQQ